MNGTVIFSGIVIFFIVSGLISFVNDLQENIDVKSSYTKDTSEYYITNAFGDEILTLTGLSLEEKKRIWRDSELKNEMLELFPNFIEMKRLIEERIEADAIFKELLLKHLSNIEEQYIGGVSNGQSAKASLSSF